MTEILATIALLCQVSTGLSSDTSWTKAMEEVDKYQVKCQKYYISCIKSKVGDWSDRLWSCAKGRK